MALYYKKCPYCQHTYEHGSGRPPKTYGSKLVSCSRCGRSFLDKDKREIALEGIRFGDDMILPPFDLITGIVLAAFGAIFFLGGMRSGGMYLILTVLGAGMFIIGILIPIVDVRTYKERLEKLDNERKASERRLQSRSYVNALIQNGLAVSPDKVNNSGPDIWDGTESYKSEKTESNAVTPASVPAEQTTHVSKSKAPSYYDLVKNPVPSTREKQVPDYCKAEFQKAIKAGADHHNYEETENSMRTLADEHNYIPAILWLGKSCENSKSEINEALSWYMKAASLGSETGARYYANLSLLGKSTGSASTDVIKFYEPLAASGKAEAYYLLGDYYLNRGEIEKAKENYKAAQDGGFEPAGLKLKKLMVE